MERTGIEPVTSGLQKPDFKARLGQVRSVSAMLCWLCEVEIGYWGHGSGHAFGVFAPVSQAVVGRPDSGAQGRSRAATQAHPVGVNSVWAWLTLEHVRVPGPRADGNIAVEGKRRTRAPRRRRSCASLHVF